ncbi:MAG: hypothetical protein ACRC5T_12515 [Cetobacterium sp.]
MTINNWEIIRKICLHKATIKGFETVINIYTDKSLQEEVVKYIDVDCLYNNEVSNLEQNRAENTLSSKGLLIVSPDLIIRNGDIITVDQGGGTELLEFEAHNIWYYPNSHKEIDLVLKEVV